jgi:histidyl-tRNA synthetase
MSSRAQDAILGGGRYDDMMKEFGGPDICGIGFAMGMERLLSVVPTTKKKEQFLYLAYLGDEPKRAGMILVQFLRKEGVECLMEYREKHLKNQLSRANKLGATWALIIGDDEVRKRKYQLKNMVTGQQTECSQEEILNFIRDNA